MPFPRMKTTGFPGALTAALAISVLPLLTVKYAAKNSLTIALVMIVGSHVNLTPGTARSVAALPCS